MRQCAFSYLHIHLHAYTHEHIHTHSYMMCIHNTRAWLLSFRLEVSVMNSLVTQPVIPALLESSLRQWMKRGLGEMLIQGLWSQCGHEIRSVTNKSVSNKPVELQFQFRQTACPSLHGVAVLLLAAAPSRDHLSSHDNMGRHVERRGVCICVCACVWKQRSRSSVSPAAWKHLQYQHLVLGSIRLGQDIHELPRFLEKS